MTIFWLLFIGGLLLPCLAEAGGIDCGKAATQIDRAICGDKALLRQDGILASEVSQVLAAVKHPDADASLALAFLRQQKMWLAKRDKTCADAASTCLMDQYQTRSLALTLLLDRVDGTALMDIEPVLMIGVWSAPDGLVMLSPQDDRNGGGAKIALDQPLHARNPQNYFPASFYRQSGLPLPGGKITNTADGQTCFSGTSYLEPAYRNLPIAAPSSDDGCARYGWQKTSLKYIWQDMYGTNSVDGIVNSTSDLIPDWFPSPTLIEHDLNAGPETTAYIAYHESGNPNIPRAFMFVVQGPDGALYAPVSIISTDSKLPNNLAYQKWLPVTPEAGMRCLTP